MYISVFLATEYAIYYLTVGGLFGKIIQLLIFYGKMIYTIAGTIFIYTLSLMLINKYHISISKGMVRMSGMCFGIYLYQQFILIFLSYRTDIVEQTGILAAPWLCFVITLILSTLLSYLTIQTRIGRALIG